MNFTVLIHDGSCAEAIADEETNVIRVSSLTRDDAAHLCEMLYPYVKTVMFPERGA